MITTLVNIAFALNLFYLVAASRGNEGFKTFEEEIKCPDGSTGVVEHIQRHSVEPFQAAIYKVDCSSSRGWNNTLLAATDTVTPALEKRQSSLCSASCSTQCYGGTGIPLKSDCDTIANNLASRGQTHTVNSGQRLVASSGTCLFRFTNQGTGSVTWCDSYWASQSRSMESQCLPQTPGAYCTGTSHLLDVCLNPDAPATTSSAAPTYVAASPNPTSNSSNRAADSTTVDSSTSSSSQTSSSGTASSSSTSSASGSQSSTVSGTSSAATAPVPGLSGYLPESSSGAVVQSIGTSNDATQKQGPNGGAIAGGVIGGLVVLALLFLLLWRRRTRSQKGHIEALDASSSNQQTPEMDYSEHGNTSIMHNEPAIAPGRVVPPAPWYSKAALARHQQRPLVLQSGNSAASSAQQLLSPTEDSSVPDTPHSSASMYPLSTQGMPEQGAPVYDIGRRSMSARTLAQTLAPDLSERDIRRLADTIVARMQAGVPLANQDVPSSGTGDSSVIVDPPPPWRASWNSETTDARSRIA